MQIPSHTLIGNLRFTSNGTVWADYLLDGLSYGLRPVKEKQLIRQAHTQLLRALPGESLLLGITSTVDPLQLVEKMMEGLDPADVPEWAAECEATLTSLERLQPGRRLFWLSVPLPAPTKVTGAAMVGRTAIGRLRQVLGLPRETPSPTLVTQYLAAARKAVQGVPSLFKPTPATPAQMVWLHQHMLDRGLYQDWNLPDKLQDEVTPAVARSKGRTAMAQPLLDEAGQTDLHKDPEQVCSACEKKTGRKAVLQPFQRRYLKVQDPLVSAGEASYQSLLVITDTPDAGMSFPGGELLGRVDESGLSVDWAMRLHCRGAAEVMLRNQRALNNLAEQMKQREDELSHSVSALDNYAELQAQYAAIFETDKLEVEVQATTVLCVAGPDPDSAMEQARGLAAWVSEWGYRAQAPLGQQETMWWAMVPGVPTGEFVREYAQISTSADVAVWCPLATVAVGDTRGSVLGLNIGNGPLLDVDVPCGPVQLVYHDPDSATDRHLSGSMAFTGDLGSGKSVALKGLAGDVLDRGGRIFVPDRTEMGEWARWAQSVTDPKVVDVADPDLSLDPLRLFGRNGSRMALSLLTPLLNLSPTSEQGVLLGEVLDPSYLARYEIGSLGGLVAHLTDGCEAVEAEVLARKIRVFARQGICRVFFDDTLPAISLDDRAIVILTHGLELPTNDELRHRHLFEQLPIEKIFGRALYTYLAVLAERLCFEDPDHLAAFIVDEAHFVTGVDEGTAIVKRFVRDGRKHRAILLLGSHDAEEDFPSEVLRGLIPYRVLLRHTDPELARRGLRWLGLDPADEALVELITKDTSPLVGDEVPEHRRGEGLMRDSAGRYGRIKVLLPARHSRNQAVRTGGRKDMAAAA